MLKIINQKSKKGCHQENSFQEKNKKGSVSNGFLWNKHVMKCQYSRFIMNVTRSKMPGLIKFI